VRFGSIVPATADATTGGDTDATAGPDGDRSVAGDGRPDGLVGLTTADTGTRHGPGGATRDRRDDDSNGLSEALTGDGSFTLGGGDPRYPSRRTITTCATCGPDRTVTPLGDGCVTLSAVAAVAFERAPTRRGKRARSPAADGGRILAAAPDRTLTV
jgi:hypothetical protein